MLAYSLHHFGHDPPSFLPTNDTEGNKKLLCAFYARYEHPILFWAALSPTCQAPHLAFAALAPYSWMGDYRFTPAHAFGREPVFSDLGLPLNLSGIPITYFPQLVLSTNTSLVLSREEGP